ncbi:MAG TPA: TolC family outer membrane protein [Parvularculaceae bacterium]|nr:TolC family outer membrane protein [Parvularculaceae bacterium]
MRNARLIALLSGIATAGAPAAAQSLEEALSLAYETNPTIAAERARQRATKEQTAQAWSQALPQIQGSANYAKIDETQNFNQTVFGQQVATDRDFNLTSKTASISGEQPIFTGLRNFNAIRAAKARVKAGNAQLALVEQDVLQRAAQAYFDVVRDMAVYDATKNNVDVLLRQQREAQLRFDVGEVTKTDVAQADARLAQSRAQLTTAQARLAVSRATFAEIIGQTPATLDPDPGLPPAPTSLEDAQAIAAAGAPVVIRARMAEQASRRNVAVAKGAFSPTISLTASYQYAEEPNSFINTDEQFAYGARATVPIFLGGLNISRVREAKALNEADRRRIDEAERRATAAVTGAWEQLQAARANIVSATAQVEANELALTGVRREAQLGVRTTLDVLDAEQEFLNAQVALANAERDARTATFQLLAAMGVLGPEGAPAFDAENPDGPVNPG